MRVLDLFSAAAGGWSLGMHRAGYHTIAACEVIDWRRVLYSENNPGVPVYDDVTTLTADRLVLDGVGLPDIIVGSPPCQDISSANTKGKGVDGERSGLYFEAVRLIDECRPRWFALENSSNLRTRGADRIIDALAAVGYTCWCFVVSAGDVGANHPRKRSWLIGFNARDLTDANGIRRDAGWQGRRGWLDLSVPHGVDGEGDARNSHSLIEGQIAGVLGGPDSILERSDARDTEEDGCGQRRSRRPPLAVAGAQVEACGDADTESVGYEGGRARGCGPDGYGEASVASGVGNTANSNEAGQEAGLLESSLRSPSLAVDGRSDVWGDVVAGPHGDRTEHGEMGRSESAGSTLAEPWADWNGGLAHHLRMDDGLSSWVAQSRIAVGGPKGTVAASLIVEAFGDAVLPQIPEAIGRAIWRVEAALAAIAGPANTNVPASEAA